MLWIRFVKNFTVTLIKSISGIRGTIGGKPGDGLTPLDAVKFASAYGMWIKSTTKKKALVLIGRDARMSGEMIASLVIATLNGLGIDVIDTGLSTTPTVEMAVVNHKADGGIILTASHNPKQWNALKLLNAKGEFISDAEGKAILEMAEKEAFSYAEVDALGTTTFIETTLQEHIDAILKLPYVDTNAVKSANFKIVVDAINSSGSFAVPALLKAMGVSTIQVIHGEVHGNFAHNPEPLPEHLIDLSTAVRQTNAHLGISVDPDVDRLAMVCEDGSMFGEEYTLVAVADAVLSFHKGGNTVSNLSSTRALRDITEAFGGTYAAAAVGEVNVVTAMKQTNALIGGEGNGGVILPELHYGRDALVGIAIYLTHLAKKNCSASALRRSYPNYVISKNKIELTPAINVDDVLAKVKGLYANQPINTVDGVKIEFGNEWVHLRKSNTEPIIRIYAESKSEEMANQLAIKIMGDIKSAACLL